MAFDIKNMILRIRYKRSLVWQVSMAAYFLSCRIHRKLPIVQDICINVKTTVCQRSGILPHSVSSCSKAASSMDGSWLISLPNEPEYSSAALGFIGGIGFEPNIFFHNSLRLFNGSNLECILESSRMYVRQVSVMTVKSFSCTRTVTCPSNVIVFCINFTDLVSIFSIPISSHACAYAHLNQAKAGRI